MPESSASFEEAVVALRHAVWADGDGARAYVAGQEPSGLLLVRVETKNAEFTLKVPDVGMLQALIGPQLVPPRTDLALPYRSRTAGTWPSHARDVVDEALVLLTGPDAQQVDAIEALRTPGFELAGYTCRGPTQAKQGLEYKSFNEDGLLLRARLLAPGREIVAIGAFDQAGGEGAKDDEPGAASDAGARCFARLLADIEAGHDIEEVLHEVAVEADAAVRALGVGAVATMTVAVIVRDDKGIFAHVANLGDSRVIHAGPDGTLKNASALHNMGARVSRGEVAEVPRVLALHFAAGLTRGLGAEDSHADISVWPLSPGDRLVVATDGLGDAHEMEEMPIGAWHAEHCSRVVARIVAGAADAVDAVNALAGYALDQAADRRGKPDNIAVGVICVR